MCAKFLRFNEGSRLISDLVSHRLNEENDSPLNRLNQFIMQLFQVDDDIHDLIREAIASNNTEELQEEAIKTIAQEQDIPALIEFLEQKTTT